ncbi:interferon-induced protein with tetratricopeptide repeats 5-like [Scyliorhinus canicula]|uniref:interferon-induced protein with tetratricopeptide repeats 5-like n=1 Tax=Scyliorhinus canicula TaxID=7830 RepID=UPI0018F4016B|nr:interferon-induced protein with tetratricopeptide repeats 5-like [Scyliorhinus canicula]
MSNTQKDLLKVKLDQLQCHFTWAPQRENIDLVDIKQRLQDSIDLGVNYQARSYNQLAFVNCLQRNCEEAIQNLEEAERILRENHEDEFDTRIIITYGNYAWVYYHMEQLTEAQSYLDRLERICEQFPDASRYTAMLPEVYGEKGWSLLSSAAQYYEEAKECFEMALTEDSANIEWNVGYATALSRLEVFSGTAQNISRSEAVRQWRRVLELDPHDSVAKVQLALKLQQRNQKEEALILVEQALDHTPADPYVLRYAAKFYRIIRDVEKAVELLNRGLEATQHSTFLHHQIGQCYRTKLNPLIRNRGSSDFQLWNKLINKCKFHFQKAIENRPLTSIKVHLDLAEICALNKEYDEAKKIYKHLLTLQGIRPEDKQEICLQTGLFELNYMKSESNAITHFLEGMKVNYDSRQRRRCREKLEMIAARQLRRNPGDSKALLGSMHQLDGEKCEAIKCFEEALKFDPGNEEYLSAIFELRLSTEANNDFPN